MVVSDSQSKPSSASSSLDLSLENLSISSATEELGASDEDICLDHLSPEEDTHKAHKSPFDVWYIRDEVWPCRRDYESDTEDDLGDSNSSEESSDSDTSSPSPIHIPSHKKRGPQRRPLTMRESLLEEAWERKRKLYLKQELVNLKDRADIRTLGRSSSDCGKPTDKHEPLERSMSDCGKANKDPLITPNRLRRTRTRSLTDEDFEELKGCLDLGFRFDQSSIADLCETLPALEAVCAVTQDLQESLTASPAPSPTPSWSITSPGDNPEEVKEKLRHWAQAVACSARLCY